MRTAEDEDLAFDGFLKATLVDLARAMRTGLDLRFDVRIQHIVEFVQDFGCELLAFSG